MKQDVELFVQDVIIYSNSLVKSLQRDHTTESLDYIAKIKKQLDSIEKYLTMKKAVVK